MLPALSIDPNDGTLHIAGFQQSIGPRLSANVAMAVFGALYESRNDHGNGYEWLTFRRVGFAGHLCSFSLCFGQGMLERVRLGIVMPDATLEQGWPDRVTNEREVALVRAELRCQLGRSFAAGRETFAWGEAWSVFDANGWLANSGISYALV